MELNPKLANGFVETMKRNVENGNMDDLTKGQSPYFAMTSCSDSRVVAPVLHNADLGEVFSHITIGNIIPPYQEGETHSEIFNAYATYAIEHLGVKELVNQGHTGCGAAKAIVTGLEDPNITPYLTAVGAEILEQAKASVAKDADQDTLLRAMEEQMVIHNLAAMKTYPAVEKALENNQIKVYSILFDIANKQLLELDPETNSFTVAAALPESQSNELGHDCSPNCC